jgi:hypothetical protein
MKQMFETGDLVYWVIDGKKRTGIFIQQLGDLSEVMCTSFEGTAMAIKTKVINETGVRSVMVAHFTSSKKERFDSILTLYKQKYL